MTAPTRVLVVGAAGMLGHVVLRVFGDDRAFAVRGTVRSERSAKLLPAALRDRLMVGVDAEQFDSVAGAVAEAKPHVVVNCVGIVKQLGAAEDPLTALPINALFPHQLARLCAASGARMIHVSTDCVFSGSTGSYVESDFPDAGDLYGRSKLLGEVDYPNAVTLRTSIIGHELGTAHGLVEWFLSQGDSAKGYRKAIFSGLPTVELAGVMRDHVLTKPDLRGVYHVAAAPIAKIDLLTLIAKQYGRPTKLVPDDVVKIDRSLDGGRFRAATGYVAPDWPELVRRMHQFH